MNTQPFPPTPQPLLPSLPFPSEQIIDQLQLSSLVIHPTKWTMTVLDFYCLLRRIYGGIGLTDAAYTCIFQTG